MLTDLPHITLEERERFFIHCYRMAYPAVAGHISKMGGSFNDAKDVFQDALLIYYEKIVNNALPGDARVPGYLVGIAKHLWLRNFREGGRTVAINDAGKYLHDEQSIPGPSADKLLHFLQTAGEKCMKVLKAFYYDNLTVEQIAVMFNYSGIRSATVQKYKCMEKVRETIKEKSLAYEDFLE